MKAAWCRWNDALRDKNTTSQVWHVQFVVFQLWYVVIWFFLLFFPRTCFASSRPSLSWTNKLPDALEFAISREIVSISIAIRCCLAPVSHAHTRLHLVSVVVGYFFRRCPNQIIHMNRWLFWYTYQQESKQRHRWLSWTSCQRARSLGSSPFPNTCSAPFYYSELMIFNCSDLAMLLKV